MSLMLVIMHVCPFSSYQRPALTKMLTVIPPEESSTEVDVSQSHAGTNVSAKKKTNAVLCLQVQHNYISLNVFLWRVDRKGMIGSATKVINNKLLGH